MHVAVEADTTTGSACTTMDHTQLRALVEAGTFKRWVGIDAETTLDCTVYIQEAGNRRPERIELSIDTDYSGSTVLECGEVGHEASGMGVLPSNDSVRAQRWAAIHGINIGGRCSAGGGTRPTPVIGCTCAYDIETDISDLEGTSFPLPDARIISLAISCSCGLTWAATTDPCNSQIAISVGDAAELVGLFIDKVIDHMPLWLVGWNNFVFDNPCLLMSSPESCEL